MRLWTLHPKYLDVKGLTAAWREALLAQKVLQGLTRGYTRHPALDRFRAQADPMAAIADFLRGVHREAEERGYRFDKSKIASATGAPRIPVSEEEIRFEHRHLIEKLATRDPKRCEPLNAVRNPDLHELFLITSKQKSLRRPE